MLTSSLILAVLCTLGAALGLALIMIVVLTDTWHDALSADRAELEDERAAYGVSAYALTPLAHLARELGEAREVSERGERGESSPLARLTAIMVYVQTLPAESQRGAELALLAWYQIGARRTGRTTTARVDAQAA